MEDSKGKHHNVGYTKGKLDCSQVRDSTRPKPYPLKIYYQKSAKSQGIDIRVRDRVIMTGQMEYVWDDFGRHQIYNDIVGELVINDPDFSTVNNKTELDPNNPLWHKLLDMLQTEEYRPEGKSYNRNEDQIVDELKKKLESLLPNSTVYDHRSSWSSVVVDIIHSLDTGLKEEHIYEVKDEEADPKAVYQLVMYWDAQTERGFRPKIGRLVAPSISSHATDWINYFNNRLDKTGNKYVIEFKSVKDLLGEKSK